MLTSVEAISRALNQADVRYLLAGGLAVNAHGYLRMTQDVDIVIDLVPENITAALRALATLGYKPTLPVSGEDFADSSIRNTWVKDKNMLVFPLWSEQHPGISIDLFAEAPFDFDAEYQQAFTQQLVPGLEIPFVSLPTLISMKEKAGRYRDLDDIEHLRWLQEDRDDS